MQLPFFCGRDCGGDACPLLAELEEGRVTRIFNNPAAGSFIKGCRRGFAMARQHYDSERLLRPLIRRGPRGSRDFREASWNEALDTVADRLAGIRARNGDSSVLALGSAGTTGCLHGTSALLGRYLGATGGASKLESSYSNGASRFVLHYMLGSDWKNSGFDPATMRYAKLIILWGANILETRLGAELPQRLLEAKRRGARIVSIDPRKTATVINASTQWIPCRPGTDAAFMLAILHVLFSEGLADRGFLRERSFGWEELEDYVLGRGAWENGRALNDDGEKTGYGDDGGRFFAKSPEWAEAITGVPAAAIRDLARTWAAAKPAMLLPGYSIQRVRGGEEPFRLALALQLATGNFGQLGGSTGSMNSRLPLPRVGSLPEISIPDMPSVPVLRWPDFILEGKAGGYGADIKAVYVCGANFVNQGADILKSLRAMNALEFSVCHEMFLTPTARCCDVVLPVASPLEKSDIGKPWLGNYLLFKPRILEPRGYVRSDYDIFRELAERAGKGALFSLDRGESEWIDSFITDSEIPDPETFKATGIYMGADQERVGLAKFAKDPRAHPLGTPSGLVELASATYASDTGYSAIPIWRGCPPDPLHPLLLVTPKVAYRTHSQGGLRMDEIQPHRLEMNARDAAELGITEGMKVRVSNAKGRTEILVVLSDSLMRGVVSLPDGAWFSMSSDGVELAG